MVTDEGMRVRQAALSQPVTQEEFGLLVGISQQAVSSLLRRGILLPEQSAREWLIRYLAHLREETIARWSGKGMT